MKYRIFVNPKLEKVFSKLDKGIAKRIRDKIRDLAVDPRPIGAIKLSGQDNAFRVRVGDYRIIYEIYDQKVLVMVINVGHRKNIYL